MTLPRAARRTPSAVLACGSADSGMRRHTTPGSIPV